MISKFELPDLENLCDKVLGKGPPRRFEIDGAGKPNYLPPNRLDYEQFIRSRVFSLQQIKDFAIKYQIVPPSFFGTTTESDEDKKES